MKKISFLLLFLVFSGSVVLAATPLRLGGRFVTNELGFSIKFPKGWVNDRSFINGVLFKNKEDGANISIMKVPIDSGTTFQEFARDHRKELPKLLGSTYRMIEDKSFNIGKMRGRIFSGTISIRNTSVYNRQLILKKGNDIFVITLGATTNDQPKYKKFSAQIFRSFR